MTQLTCTRFVMAWLAIGLSVSVSAMAREAANGPNCKAVHADLVEDRATVGCKPEHSFCFLGEVDGNHGLRGTTYFRGDSSGSRPPTSPDFVSYSGVFEYTTSRGMLVARETGVVNTTSGNPDSGALTAFQKIIDATGEFAGVTGHFFVSGFNVNNHIVTKVTGQICYPD
jgi:hypothetical protein